MYFSSVCTFGSFVKNQLAEVVWTYVQILYFNPLASLSLFVPMLSCFAVAFYNNKVPWEFMVFFAIKLYMKAALCSLLHSTPPRARGTKEEHTETTCRMIKRRQFCFTKIEFTVVVTTGFAMIGYWEARTGV